MFEDFAVIRLHKVAECGKLFLSWLGVGKVCVDVGDKVLNIKAFFLQNGLKVSRYWSEITFTYNYNTTIIALVKECDLQQSPNIIMS